MKRREKEREKKSEKTAKEINEAKIFLQCS